MSKGKLRKWMVLFIAMFLSVVLAACSASTTAKKEKAASSSDKSEVKLRIAWWGSQERHDATLKAIELYEKKNPNVKFEMEYSGLDGYFDKLATQAAGKNAPDLIQMEAIYLREYAERNQLTDLTGKINLDNVEDTLIEAGKVDGKLYVVPLGNNAHGIIYNKSILEKLGVEIPQAGWTWDELFALAREVQPLLGEGVYALKDFTTISGVYEMYQLSKGKGHISNKDGSFNIDKGTWLEWVNTFAELRKEGVVPPAEINVSDQIFDPTRDLLLNGTVLIKNAYAAEFPGFNSVIPGSFELVAAPKDKEAGGYLKPSMSWAVSEHSQHKEEAQKFIEFFIHDPEAAQVLGSSRGLPVDKTILEKLSKNFTEAQNMQLKLTNETIPTAQIFNGGPKGYGKFSLNAYVTVTDQVIFGELEPEEAFEEIKRVFKESTN